MAEVRPDGRGDGVALVEQDALERAQPGAPVVEAGVGLREPGRARDRERMAFLPRHAARPGRRRLD